MNGHEIYIRILDYLGSIIQQRNVDNDITNR